ncbi:Nucleolar pre-ribosomal-associated protein 2 [Candida viswanathii]|uniref:Nucleolar pre-ribosomal-associated protein 2 n=1 Tax=Candida viswanathii TaxID=5486 RepID=A0A367YF59_9ASCO|nr:Nucleolar pre-ribosomal-associated protein 2 [Candida viswanathii]
MSNLDTAEGVTKFLRSKDASLADIVSTASRVLDDSLDIYLPGKKLFVLNLLCDRLNDKSNGKFGKWKFDINVWKLFIKTWEELSHDKLEREKSIQKLKIIEIAVILLNQSHDNEVLKAMFQVLEILLKESYIEADENLAIQLLKSFIEHKDMPVDQEKVLKWTELVRDIYTRAALKLTLEGSKKFYSKFFEECGFSLIRFLLTSNQQLSSAMVEELLIQRIFDEESTQYFQSNLERALKKQEMDAEILICLYQITVDQLAAKHMKICEETYSIISSKYPALSEKLLSILASSNKTISHEFIESIYKTEIGDKNFKDLNWAMVKYIFEIDSELASKKSSFLFKTYQSHFGLDDKVLPVGRVIVDGYLKNRELVEFFTKIWPRAIKRDELWESDSFIDKVAETVKSFSGKQLKSVIETCYSLELECHRAIFTAITKGLTSAPVRLVEAVKPTLLDQNDYFNSKENFWGIRYYLLCCFGKEFSIPDRILKPDIDLYYHYTVFRLLELQVITEYSKSNQEYFMATIKDHLGSLTKIFRRWLVIFNHFFDGETLSKLLALAHNQIVYNDIFFEQTKLTTALIKFILDDIEERVPLLLKIPIVCFNKSQKKKILNSLMELDLSREVLETIQYMLLQPSLLSKLETDSSSLLKLLKAADGDTKDITQDIVKTVWKNSIQQVKREDIEEYVIGTLANVNKYLSSSDAVVVDAPETELALIILSNTHEEVLPQGIAPSYTELKKSFTRYCIDDLNNGSSKNVPEIAWLISALVICSSDTLNYEDVKVFLSGLSGETLSDKAIQSAVFELICQTIPIDYRGVIYVLSLFTALKSEGTPELYNCLIDFLKKVTANAELFLQAYQFFVKPLRDVPAEFTGSFVQISCAFLDATTKETNSASCNSASFSFFIDTMKKSADDDMILFILSNLRDLLTSKAWLFNQYLLETTFVIINRAIRQLPDLKKQENVYILASQVMSHILLYHRFKIATRHHLILNVVSSLLEPLANGNTQSTALSTNENAGAAYARLLSNLCEPIERVGDKMTHLTTSANYFKKILRRHLPVLLSNYIHFSLKYTFSRVVNDAIILGIYSIFDVLSQAELRIVNASLDYGGRSLYKTLYNDYKDHGKWKDN